MFTQSNYNLLKTPTRYLYVKINLLNDNDIIIDSLEGISIDGSLNIDSESTYRRTGNLTMIVENDLIPSPTSKIWFNKRIQILIGLKDYNDNITWFPQGKYSIKSCDLDLDKSDKTISFECLDYMSFLDGTLSGRLSNETEILAEGITINEALQATFNSLAKISLDEILVNGSTALIPYDITQEPNSTIYDLAKLILDLYMNYEMFFDDNGYLRVQKIQDYKTDPIIWDFSENNMNLVINYTSKLNLDNVNNSIYVWGKLKDTGEQISWVYRNRYDKNTTEQRDAITDQKLGDICHLNNEGKSYCWDGGISPTTGGTIQVTLAPTVSGNITLTLTPTIGSAENIIIPILNTDTINSVASKITSKINSKQDYYASCVNDTITIRTNLRVESVIISFVDTDSTGVTTTIVNLTDGTNASWQLLDFIVVPEFNITRIGEKIWAYSDDTIYTENQAKLRAEYELTQHSNFAEEVSFSCIPIYILTVNRLVRLVVSELGIDGVYKITKISFGLSIDSLMNITCTKMYY